MTSSSIAGEGCKGCSIVIQDSCNNFEGFYHNTHKLYYTAIHVCVEHKELSCLPDGGADIALLLEGGGGGPTSLKNRSKT